MIFPNYHFGVRQYLSGITSLITGLECWYSMSVRHDTPYDSSDSLIPELGLWFLSGSLGEWSLTCHRLSVYHMSYLTVCLPLTLCAIDGVVMALTRGITGYCL